MNNALAETVIGLYKTELIRGPNQGPCDSTADVEFATSVCCQAAWWATVSGQLGCCSSASITRQTRPAILRLRQRMASLWVLPWLICSWRTRPRSGTGRPGRSGR